LHPKLKSRFAVRRENAGFLGDYVRFHSRCKCNKSSISRIETRLLGGFCGTVPQNLGAVSGLHHST
jgi:hypothetical protein